MTTIITPQPAPRQGVRPPVQPPSAPAQVRKRGRRWLRPAIAVVLIAAGSTAALVSRVPQADRGLTSYDVDRRSFSVTINEKGDLEAAKSVDVKCEVEGRSTIIWLIPEGTEVKEGDLLVKLASNEIEEKVRSEQIAVQKTKAAAEAAEQELEITLDQNLSDVRKAELAVRNAEIELRKYVEGDYTQQLLQKQSDVETAIKKKDRAADLLEDSRDLHGQGFLTERELRDDELSFYEADVQVRISENELSTFLEYVHPKELKQRQSDLEEAQKDLERTLKKTKALEAKQRAARDATDSEYKLTQDRLDKLLEQQAKTEIHAPASGLVVYETGHSRWNQVQIAEGSEVFERQTIIALPDPSAMIVKLRIHEAKTGMLALGQPAVVEVEGIPNETFTGKVTKIAPLADSQNSWLNPDLKEYDTEIALDQRDRNLKPGVTARARISVRQIDDVLAVPVQAVFSSAGHAYVFKGGDENTAAPVEVEIGHASDEYVEVRGGLSANERILLAVSDALLAKLPTTSETTAAQSAEEETPPAENAPRGRRGPPRAGRGGAGKS